MPGQFFFLRISVPRESSVWLRHVATDAQRRARGRRFRRAGACRRPTSPPPPIPANLTTRRPPQTLPFLVSSLPPPHPATPWSLACSSTVSIVLSRASCLHCGHATTHRQLWAVVLSSAGLDRRSCSAHHILGEQLVAQSLVGELRRDTLPKPGGSADTYDPPPTAPPPAAEDRLASP